jgi:hypothetical protein
MEQNCSPDATSLQLATVAVIMAAPRLKGFTGIRCASSVQHTHGNQRGTSLMARRHDKPWRARQGLHSLET